MPEQEIVALAKVKACAHALNPSIFCGLIERETQWDNWCIRFEREFLAKYLAPLELRGELHDPSEIYGRAFSWGPCQVMGEEARERGYKGHLAQLCEWNVGLEIGAQVLAHKFSLHPGNVSLGLLAYNGGANQKYDDEVLALSVKYA